jgi:hypothetical protein
MPVFLLTDYMWQITMSAMRCRAAGMLQMSEHVCWTSVLLLLLLLL